MFLKNTNIIFKIRRSKVTDYAALNVHSNFIISRRIVVSYKRTFVHEVLVIRLVKLAQEKGVVR